MTEHTRPLSPHLSIYKSQITMVMSIMHRITGVGLTLGTLVIAWWLVAATQGDAALTQVYAISGSWFGQLVMFGFTWALFHHMLGGLRHFVWDTGQGFSESVRFGFAWATLIGGLVLAALVWVFFVWM